MDVLPSNAEFSSRPAISRWLVLVVVFLLGYVAANYLGLLKSRRVHNPLAESQPVAPRGDLADDERSTVELFRRQSPAVVFITTARVGFDWGRFDETTLSQGSGSGFIWSEDGYVVTNDHVISTGNFAQVTLFDQSVWQAELVGRAPGKDLAVLKIDAPVERLQRILLGRSDDLQVGQKVFAIGNPFGLDQTLTTGVISALDRQIGASELSDTVVAKRTIEGVIQTDAAINPGNSGGPLLDSAGRLIGVNTAIYSPSGAYAGVGFAIPVDTVNRIVPQLIRHGRIIRPDVGVIPFRDQWTRQWNLTGVLVRDVVPNSTAAAVGIQATQAIESTQGGRTFVRIRYGDLIVAVDGAPIEDLDDWYSFLEKHQPGDQVKLAVIRDLRTLQQRSVEIDVTLAEPSE